ncbi:hypothetical protein BIY21_19350 [Vibrio ponticus]|uniref:LXG domain-containing protein n=1 Tax=Vibrio ponticus TaxID=265668 RepID=A0ABX3F818_9VIBR|nr:hypothetical protein [Vibrio ponticus]OLQ85148.1 hypothetical protein BIY21_19350 [Vibrio ponticus]
MQPTFDTAFYQRNHMDLEDELMKLALAVQSFKEQSQTLSAIWSDDAGRRIRQIHMLPLVEQYGLFEGTAKQYLQSSEERLRSFYEMKRLISEYAGLHSSLEEREDDVLRVNDEYHRVTAISERQRDKGVEFAYKSEQMNRQAQSYVNPL